MHILKQEKEKVVIGFNYHQISVVTLSDFKDDSVRMCCVFVPTTTTVKIWAVQSFYFF